MSDEKKGPVEILKGEESLLTDHEYDGIRELDHVLPRWWLMILYGTIAFAFWYCATYMTGFGPSSRQELARDLKELDARKPAPPKDAGVTETAALLAAYHDPAKIQHGHEVFGSKCFACHGDKGQGVVGPNLTDDFWIHGKGSLQDVATVVKNGVPDKGMPAWGQVLTPEEVRDVVSFVHSLHGSNPPNGKAPQGEKQDFVD